MEYLCPVCGKFMIFIAIPTKNHYRCSCGYRSKYLTDDDLLTPLPRELRQDNDELEKSI